MENFEIKDLGNSEIEITAQIPADEYESYRESVLKKLGESMEIDGFRKGSVPNNVIEEKAGDVTVLHEMASQAIADFYPKLIADKNIEAIGRPEVTITKMAKDNPLEFKAKTAVLPDFTLPDYKGLAQQASRTGEENDVEVTDDEVDKTILEIRTNWAHQMEQVKNAGKQTEEGKEGEEEKSQDDSAKADNGAKEEPALPELTDEFVAQLGDFKNVADFKEKLRENLKEEKRSKEREKKRGAIIEEILKNTTISVPEVLVTGELDRMMAQFKDNVAMMGQKPEDYFKQIQKTEDEVKEGWRDDAVKRVKTQLILQKIADEENVSVPEEEIQKQIKEVLEKYPGVKEEQARGYVENILTNEKTFELLEKASE